MVQKRKYSVVVMRWFSYVAKKVVLVKNQLVRVKSWYVESIKSRPKLTHFCSFLVWTSSQLSKWLSGGVGLFPTVLCIDSDDSREGAILWLRGLTGYPVGASTFSTSKNSTNALSSASICLLCWIAEISMKPHPFSLLLSRHLSLRHRMVGQSHWLIVNSIVVAQREPEKRDIFSLFADWLEAKIWI